MLQTIRTQLLDPSNGILWQSCYHPFSAQFAWASKTSLQDCHPAAAAGTRCVLRRALLLLALMSVPRSNSVSLIRLLVTKVNHRTQAYLGPGASTMQLLETMRSDLSVWTHVACMSWFGAGLCSMALNGCSHVLEPWISHVVHISFAQRLSLSCGYSQAFCLWLVQHWDESHVFFFSAWLVPYLRCKWLPKSQLTTANFQFYRRGGR